MDIITSCVPNGSGVREGKRQVGRHAHMMSANSKDLFSLLLVLHRRSKFDFIIQIPFGPSSGADVVCRHAPLGGRGMMTQGFLEGVARKLASPL